MSGKSISVHPTFGVNPTIPVCLFCGESKNEIVLLGGDGYKVRNEHNGRYESAEAPMRMVLDTFPCDTCIQTWREHGIAFVEITPQKVSTGRTQSPYEGVDTETKMLPSGRYVVVKQEAAQKILSDYPHVDDYVSDDCDFREDFEWLIDVLKDTVGAIHDKLFSWHYAEDEEAYIIFQPDFKKAYFQNKYTDFMELVGNMSLEHFANPYYAQNIRSAVHDKFGFYIAEESSYLNPLDTFVRSLPDDEESKFWLWAIVDYHY